MESSFRISQLPTLNAFFQSLVVTLMLGPSAMLFAQTEANGLQASGTAVVKLTPSRIRLTMPCEAQASDTKGAITTLIAHKQRVKTDLIALKATEESIRYSETSLGQEDGFPDGIQSYVRQNILRNANARGMGLEDFPKIYVAKCELQAEWNLPTADPDALVLLVSTLKQQIEEKDFAGINNTAQLDEEQKDKLESVRQMAMQQGYSLDDGSPASGMKVLFIAETTPEQHKEAMAKAYKNAVAKAEELAAAAGVTLDKIISLRSTSRGAYQRMEQINYPNGSSSTFPATENAEEADLVFSEKLSDLKKNITVSIIYSMK
jgi:uncharacterized protein YggE